MKARKLLFCIEALAYWMLSLRISQKRAPWSHIFFWLLFSFISYSPIVVILPIISCKNTACPWLFDLCNFIRYCCITLFLLYFFSLTWIFHTNKLITRCCNFRCSLTGSIPVVICPAVALEWVWSLAILINWLTRLKFGNYQSWLRL